MLRDTHALEIAGTSRCLPIFEKKIQLTSVIGFLQVFTSVSSQGEIGNCPNCPLVVTWLPKVLLNQIAFNHH